MLLINLLLPVGSSSITCLSTGRWSAELPHCDVIKCRAPPTFNHADVIAVGVARLEHRFNDRVRYECQLGFRLVGHSDVICEESGDWSEVRAR